MATYEKISLEKGMYANSQKSMTDILEELDPSVNYVGTPLEGLDAFSRQLKRFDIKVKGSKSDTVEKFFQTTDSSALFPEYVSRAVKQGMEEADVLSDIVAVKTNITGMDYRSITSELCHDEKSMVRIAEGALIPQTTVSVNENLVKLYKRGRLLVSTYEALRFQRIDLFTVTLKQIGAYIARAQLRDAMEAITMGDGNNNPCRVITAENNGELTYKDMLKVWGELAPYKMTTLVASADAVGKLLTNPEFKDSLAGNSFHASGEMVTPMGAKLIHTSAVPKGQVVALDKSCALEMVQAGEVLTDYDKLIDRQLEYATISCITGFAKIFNDASLKLTY